MLPKLPGNLMGGVNVTWVFTVTVTIRREPTQPVGGAVVQSAVPAPVQEHVYVGATGNVTLLARFPASDRAAANMPVVSNPVLVQAPPFIVAYWAAALAALPTSIDVYDAMPISTAPKSSSISSS